MFTLCYQCFGSPVSCKSESLLTPPSQGSREQSLELEPNGNRYTHIPSLLTRILHCAFVTSKI